MRKPISTKLHGVLDYLTIGTFMALPAVFGWSKPLSRAVQGVAVMKLGYTLFTNHELSPMRVLPMKAHLALDTMGGATLAALPFILADEDDDDSAMVVLTALGLFDIAAAPLTETTPRDQIAPEQQAELSEPRMSYATSMPTGAYDPNARQEVQHAGLSGGA